MRRAIVVAIAAGLLIGGAWAASRPDVVAIAPGTPASDLIARAADGTVIRLLPGTHGSFDVTRRVTIEADPGAVVRGPVTVLADGARLLGVRVEGGESGVVVRDADEVVLQGVSIVGARLHGIEIAPGSAVVRDCSITGLVSHVSRVEFLDNVITGTTLRALVVTEMSEGLVEGNRVRDVVGSAIYCGDMSHCEIRDNRVLGVTSSGTGIPALDGWGVVGFYHSKLHLEGNALSDTAAGAMRLSMDTNLVDSRPFMLWPGGIAGLWPGLPIATAAAAAALLAGCVGVAPWARRRRARAAELPDRRPSEALTGLVAAALGVQAFHMLEHGVQVWQVYVAAAEHRSGLLGRAFDIEWVHFAYNLAVLAFAWWLAIGAGRGSWGRRAASGPTITLLLGAAVLQTYHMAEHAAKVVQFVASGVAPTPGLLGGRAGLVWFHFAINLAVFAGLVAGAVPLLRRGRRTDIATRRRVAWSAAGA